MSVSPAKEVHVCPNVWYTFDKIGKIKFDGIRGGIRKYRLRYNLIIFIYSEGALKYNRVFREFLRDLKFLQPLEFDF